MSVFAWPYIFKSLRLEDPELIARWRVLSRYAAEIPPGSVQVFYRNVLDSSRVVSARRQRGAAALVWFHVVSAEDMALLDSLEEGEEATPFFADLKISTRYPFMLGETQAVTLSVRNGQPALPEGHKRRPFTLKDTFRRARVVKKTSFFTPTIEELDSLLAYLENAEPHHVKGN